MVASNVDLDQVRQELVDLMEEMRTELTMAAVVLQDQLDHQHRQIEQLQGQVNERLVGGNHGLY